MSPYCKEQQTKWVDVMSFMPPHDAYCSKLTRFLQLCTNPAPWSAKLMVLPISGQPNTVGAGGCLCLPLCLHKHLHRKCTEHNRSTRHAKLSMGVDMLIKHRLAVVQRKPIGRNESDEAMDRCCSQRFGCRDLDVTHVERAQSLGSSWETKHRNCYMGLDQVEPLATHRRMCQIRRPSCNTHLFLFRCAPDLPASDASVGLLRLDNPTWCLISSREPSRPRTYKVS